MRVPRECTEARAPVRVVARALRGAKQLARAACDRVVAGRAHRRHPRRRPGAAAAAVSAVNIKGTKTNKKRSVARGMNRLNCTTRGSRHRRDSHRTRAPAAAQSNISNTSATAMRGPWRESWEPSEIPKSPREAPRLGRFLRITSGSPPSIPSIRENHILRLWRRVHTHGK